MAEPGLKTGGGLEKKIMHLVKKIFLWCKTNTYQKNIGSPNRKIVYNVPFWQLFQYQQKTKESSKENHKQPIKTNTNIAIAVDSKT